ncbi:MAG: H-NS histone family protein [Thiohalocapsa sp.]|jgi:DNA-binding protein H-NS
MEYQKLSVEELQHQLDQIEQAKADLEKALQRRWQEAKSELAQQIRQMIEGHGYDVEEIAEMVMPRRRRTASSRKGTRGYTRYVDPENPTNVYVRGVLPGWLREKMTEQGYDPARKEDREAFKATYLRAVNE